jgi:hypothetical protein
MSKKRRNCELCDKSFGSKQILSHYKACIAGNYKEYAGHYVVSFFSHDEDNNFYYMYAIVNPETTFATIDKYLRNKWLACCGHASTFECENKKISNEDIFSTYADKEILYEYDMGSTTTVYIEDALLIESDIAPTKSIYILHVLRNPEWRAELVNSPRMGESCFDGYDLKPHVTYEENVTNKRGFDFGGYPSGHSDASSASSVLDGQGSATNDEASASKSRRKDGDDDEESQSDSDNNEASVPEDGDKGGASREESSSE